MARCQKILRAWVDRNNGGRRRTSSNGVANGDWQRRIDHLRSTVHDLRTRVREAGLRAQSQRGSSSSSRKKSFELCIVYRKR